jgi:hypothetical protein
MLHAHGECHGKLGWDTVTSWLPLMLRKDADLNYCRNQKQDGKVLHARKKSTCFYFCPTKILTLFHCRHGETKIV